MTKESKIWAEAEREIRRIHKHEPTDKLCDEDLCEIQAFIKGAKWVMEEYREQRWVRVEDGLPEFEQEVLVVTQYGVCAAEYSPRRSDDSTWLLGTYGTIGQIYLAKDKIKLWMPLPEPPKD